MSTYSGFGRIRSGLNIGYALNIWRGASNMNNCDIHIWAGNTEDSKIDFNTVNANQNLYRIKSVNYNLFLTAVNSSNGSDVRWQNANWRRHPVMEIG
ncbi:MAG: hypothetical protein ACK5L3_12185 [Oscillospiraceae bacterium]